MWMENGIPLPKTSRRRSNGRSRRKKVTLKKLRKDPSPAYMQPENNCKKFEGGLS